jgi:hypothetical protein
MISMEGQIPMEIDEDVPFLRMQVSSLKGVYGPGRVINARSLIQLDILSFV